MIVSAQTRTAQFAAWLRLGHYFENPWSYLLVLVTVILGLVPMMQGALAQASPPLESQPELLSEARPASRPTDGIHLYGQSPEPEQLGVGYMIFETLQDRVVGALYMPHSSFDCFQGQLREGELAMMITNSYTEEVYAHSVALESTDAIASASSSASPLQLESFYQLEAPSENDMRMLSTCKSNLQGAVEL